jgi:hypothetical protein
MKNKKLTIYESQAQAEDSKYQAMANRTPLERLASTVALIERVYKHQLKNKKIRPKTIKIIIG